MTDDSPYIAVYLAGGHGAMLGLPDSPLAANEFGRIAANCPMTEVDKVS